MSQPRSGPSTPLSSAAPMRLALVIERLDPAAGGGAQGTVEVACELAARGHDVTILAGSVRTGVTVGGVTIRAMARRRSFAAARLLRFAAWAERGLQSGFDAGVSMTTAVPATVVLPRCGVAREAVERHAAAAASGPGRAWRRATLALNARQQCLLRLERRTAASPGVARFAAVSRYVSEQLISRCGIERERVHRIPSGAESADVSAAQRAAWRAQVRSAFAVSPEQVVYLFVARVPRLKGFGTLMEATRRLVEGGGDPVVLIAGAAGYPQQAAVERSGLRGRVRFVGPTRRMPALYAAADVTVLPTFYDPASRVVIESLGMGTPVITTRYDGAGELVEEAGSGVAGEPGGSGAAGVVLDDPADAEALTRAMALGAEPGQRSAWAAALGAGRPDLSMRSHVDALERLLAELRPRAPAGRSPVGVA